MLDYWWLTMAAAAFLAIHVSQFTASAVRLHLHWRENYKRLKNRQAALQRSSSVARLASQIGVPAAASAAPQWRILEVAEVVQESVDCRSYYLIDPYGQALPNFRPGQYVMVRPALAGAYQATRCYSLSSSPDSRFWRITVKLQATDSPHSRSQTSGLSAWMHQTIGKGDCLLIGGPGGQFYLPSESTYDLVLIAAGVGITPIASMLRWSLEHTPGRPVTLLYQARDTQHWPLGRTLHQWQANFPSIQIHSFFSRASEADVAVERDELPGEFHLGKLDGSIAYRLSRSQDTDYYLCGPDSWMEQIREQLQHSGVEAAHIHWESFGSSTEPKISTAPYATRHQVRFAHSDRQADWQDPNQSLWELARENDVLLPNGCLSGVCGSCRVKLRSGKVEYDRKITVELNDDECLTCVARPLSDITLDA